LLVLSALALASADYQIPDEVEGCTEANDIRAEMIDVKDTADKAAESNIVLRSNLDALEVSLEKVNAIEESLNSRTQSFLQVYDLAAPISFLATVEKSQLDSELETLSTLMSELSSTRDTAKSLEYVHQIQDLLNDMITKTKDAIAANSETFEKAYTETLPALEEEYKGVSC